MLSPPYRLPRSTYRLQFTPQFTLDDGRELIPYLKSLGISEVYASPLFQASAQSSHGYDVNDYNRISEALGGRDALDRLSAALREAGLGLLLDFVPNHMGIDGEYNRWWTHVLENGAQSKYAPYFDVEWHPRLERLNDRVLVPMLEDYYGKVLAAGKLKLSYEAGNLIVQYGKFKLPLRPQTYGSVLEPMSELLSSDDERRNRLRELSAAFADLSMNDPEGRDKELQRLKLELAEAIGKDPQLEDLLKKVLAKFNGVPGDAPSFESLHKLLEAQHYRLAHWKVGAHEVNYRRFFAVDTLVGLKMENPEVFAATHRLLGDLVEDRVISGVRLDHIDGLWNPKEYLLRLSELVSERLKGAATIHTLVEKIIAPDEYLPEDWAIHGTSGYEFTASLIQLFLDRADEPAWTKIYQAFTGEEESSRELTYADKIFILKEMFPNAVSNLAVELNNLMQADWHWRDLSLHDLKTGLRHLLASLMVYRTYRMCGEKMNGPERKWIERAMEDGIRRNPCVDPAPIRFLARVIVGDYPPPGILDQQRPEIERWVCKLQQVTGAIMAKSVEDTHFFRYVRMMGANEVGSHPSRFGEPVSEFHRANLERQEKMPLCLLTTSTHDTKMSEDARARLFALAELPEEWEDRLQSWHMLNNAARTQVDGQTAPDAREEYALYQILLAAWPLGAALPDDNFRSRIKAYFRKFQGEAKLNTAWTHPREQWHAAGAQFIDAILNSPDFLKDFVPFARRISHRGVIFSLAQTVLHLTCPGVPDLYQGNEVWDFSLVDPDNRRPVDFDRRRDLLSTLDSRSPQELLENWQDGGIKMRVTTSLLHCRNEFPDLFHLGEYLPVVPSGLHADKVVSFLRRHGSQELLVVVPNRLGPDREFAIDLDSTVLPMRGRQNWKNLFTGITIQATAEGFSVASALGNFPVAVLLCT